MSTTIQETTQLPEITVATPAEEHRRDVFLRAAEIMERDGYAHGSVAMATVGPVCLLGAVGRALGKDAITDEPATTFVDGKYVCVSETSYDYIVTAAFVLDRNGLFDDYSCISEIYGFSDIYGKKHVVSALRAMANGKSFEEAKYAGDPDDD